MLAWDVESLFLRQTFTFHSSSVCDVDWKINSNIFVSCSYDGSIIISRIGQHQPLRSIIGYPVKTPMKFIDFISLISFLFVYTQLITLALDQIGSMECKRRLVG